MWLGQGYFNTFQHCCRLMFFLRKKKKWEKGNLEKVSGR